MFTIHPRHNGPPDSAHGGVAAGHFASLVDADREDDGLRLTPGVIPGSLTHATFWTPGVADRVPSWLTWAALDCLSGGPALAAAPRGAAVVTGEIAVDIRARLAGSAQYQLLSRCVAPLGRKILTEAAIVDTHGRNLAVAATTWIALESIAAVAS